MERLMRRLLVGVILFSITVTIANSQPPTPGVVKPDSPPQSVPAQKSTDAQTEQRGTDQFPLVVKTITPQKTEQEAAEDKTERDNKSAADWWMVRLTGLIAIIGVGQGIVFYIQARRLRQTIIKMDEIASTQTTDMGKSIEQATKASVAMQSIADSMANNVETIKGVASVNREIADRQAKLWPLQMRAYISVLIGQAVYQDSKIGLRFEGKPLLTNTGNTPAHNVRYSIKSDILPIPLAHTMDYSLPPPSGKGNLVAPHSNGIMGAVVDRTIFDNEISDIKQGKGKALVVWGKIEYEDVFGESHYTNFCQVLMWRPDNAIHGYHLPQYSDAN